MNIYESGKKKYLEAKKIIQEARREKQLVLFVGSGTSKESGLPLWEEAVEQIRNRLDEEIPSNEDKLRIPQYYYNTRGKKEYVELMKKIFKCNEKLYPRLIHKKPLFADGW